MPTLGTVTLDLAEGSGGLTGTRAFQLVDFSESSIVRKCGGATPDEGLVMNDDARTLKNGVRQVRVRVALGVVDGEGVNRLLGTVSVNQTIQFPPFATAAQINECLSLLESRKQVLANSAEAASLAIAGTLP